MMDKYVRINLLNEFKVVVGGVAIDRFKTNRIKYLLAYLAYHLSESLTRMHLIDMFWPKVELANGRDSLSTALGSLRHHLENSKSLIGEIIVSDDNDQLHLNSDYVSTDVADFITEISAARRAYKDDDKIYHYSRAIDIYQGKDYHEQIDLMLPLGKMIMAKDEWLLKDFDDWISTANSDLYAEYQKCIKLCSELIEHKQQRPDHPNKPRKENTTHPLPVGTITVLLSDVEGLQNQTGVQKKYIFSLLSRLLENVNRRFKAKVLQNEVLLIVFGDVEEAFEFAVEYHKAVCFQPWSVTIPRVRLVVYTINIRREELVEDEYPAAALKQAIAMLQAAHGGQILVSGAAEPLLRPNLKDTILVNLGEYFLGSDITEKIFMVVYPKMQPTSFPPLKAKSLSSVNIPNPRNQYFGREKEIALLQNLLHPTNPEYPRLITLSGIGGSGKTSLAIQTARKILGLYSGSVWFVSLADILDPSLILNQISDSMHLPLLPSAEPLEYIVQELFRQPSLLILDSFEHLIIDGTDIIHTLLERIPTLKCLVTSRQVLNIDGEKQIQVEPLSVPNLSDSQEELMEFSSVKMFVDRAKLRIADFCVTSNNKDMVIGICCILEGIPLSIELAATYVRKLSLSQILKRIENRLTFLVDNRRNTTERHRSLLAVMDLSYEQLTADCQVLFSRLSIFRGGWTLEAAAKVCLPEYSEDKVFEILNELCDASLIIRDENSDVIRYRILDTLREYAKGKVILAEEKQLIEGHVFYYLKLAEGAEAHVQMPDPTELRMMLELEHDNFRAAMVACEHETSDTFKVSWICLIAALTDFWRLCGHFAEGWQRIQIALSSLLEYGEPVVRFKVLRGAGHMTYSQGSYSQAIAYYERCLELCYNNEWGNELADAAVMLMNLGATASDQGDYSSALKYYDECEQAAEKAKITPGARYYGNRGVVHYYLGDYPSAEKLYKLAIEKTLTEHDVAVWEDRLGLLYLSQTKYSDAHKAIKKSLQTLQKLNEPLEIAKVQDHLGLCMLLEASLISSLDLDQPLNLLMGALKLREDLQNHHEIGISLCHIGVYYRITRNYEDAVIYQRQSLQKLESVGNILDIAESLMEFACIASIKNDWERAGKLIGAIESLLEQVESKMSPLEREKYKSVWRDRNDLFLIARRDGRKMTMKEAILYALT